MSWRRNSDLMSGSVRYRNWCLLSALMLLFPPEHIDSRLFTSVFYGTPIALSVAAVVAVVSNHPHSRTYFPAVALAAVFISPLAGGIICGFLVCLALATHVLLLIPSLRQRTPLVGWTLA